MKLSVYIATSVDGFIARKNGDLDWLPQSGGVKNIESDEDYGFGTFFKSVDTLIMGRNTYDTVRKFDTWPYSNKRVVVLTNRGIDIPDNIAQNVVAMSGAPKEIVKKLGADGARHLYIDGGM